jgi:hypothetical protein
MLLLYDVIIEYNVLKNYPYDECCVVTLGRCNGCDLKQNCFESLDMALTWIELSLLSYSSDRSRFSGHLLVSGEGRRRCHTRLSLTVSKPIC